MGEKNPCPEKNKTVK